MTENAAEAIREDYLVRLDEAMRALPHGVATEIRRGVAEELEGLDAAATAERIARLGDPARIAREALDEVPAAPALVVAPSAPPAPGPRPPLTASRGFAIAAALTLSFGGIVVPFVGWFVGVVLVVLSSLWRVWEKALAIALPLVVVAVSWLITALLTPSGGAAGEANNPLLPMSGLGGWHALILLGFLMVPVSGLWLLWRLRGAAER